MLNIEKKSYLNISWFYSAAMFLLLIMASCKETVTNPPPPPINGLGAIPNSVLVLPGTNVVVAITGGTRPESITHMPNASIATATLNDTSLTVHGIGFGSTSVQVADSSSPIKTIDLTITVATSVVSIIFKE